MALTPPPPDINLSENAVGRIIDVDVALLVFATAAVGIQVLSRIISKGKFWWDDWILAVALIFAHGNGIMSIIATQHRIGKHIWAPGVIVGTVTELIWIYEFFWGTVVPVTKMSLILLYYRIFPTPWFRRVLYGSSFLVLGWWIAIIIAAGLQCRPISHFWKQYTDPDRTGVCINFYGFFIANGSLSILTDSLIIACPIPLILRLQMHINQKVGVIGIFVLAMFACVAGVVRVYFWMYKNADLTWNQYECFIWSCIEPCIGILCACLPTLRPLISKLFRRRPKCGPQGYAKSGLSYQDGQYYPRTNSPTRASQASDDDAIFLTNKFVGGSVAALCDDCSFLKRPVAV